MGKIDPSRHGQQGDAKPALGMKDLDSADGAVLTVSEFREVTIDGRVTAVIEFDEFPDHVYWVNKSGVRALVARFGNDSDAFIGEQIPLLKVRTQNPQTGETVTKYQIPPVDEWDTVLDEYLSIRRRTGRKVIRKRTAPAKQSAKRPAKRSAAKSRKRRK